MTVHIPRCLTVLGWAMVLGFAFRAALLGGISADVRAFQTAYGVGFLGYALLVCVVTRRRNPAIPGSWRSWLTGCIAARALLLATAPGDDAYRYVWEGRIQLAGFNPFRHAPSDPQLDHLRTDDWSKINHPDYPAIYGPVAEMEFLAAAAVYPASTTLKTAHVLWDVLALILVGATLRRMGQPPHRAVLYGLCPLVLTAFGVEGHVDSLMLLFVAAALWATVAGRPHVAAAAVGLAVGTKIVAVVLLPWFIVRCRRASADAGPAVRSVPIAVAVAVLCYAPYSTAGAGLFSSLLRFSTTGEFFSFPGALGVTSFASSFTHITAAAILAGILLALALRMRALVAYAAAALQALLMLIPVVHYWYLAWVLMLVPFHVRAMWIAAAFATVVYFEAELRRQTTGTWSMPHWAPPVVWVTFLIVWGVEAAVAARASR